MRANIEKAMAAKEKEEQEQKLRLIAQKAREERSGIIRGSVLFLYCFFTVSILFFTVSLLQFVSLLITQFVSLR